VDNRRSVGLELPGPKVARDSSAGKCCGNPLHGTLLGLGTNGNQELIPQSGEISRVLTASAFSRQYRLGRPQLLVAWVALLVLGSASMCAALVLDGYRINHPVPLVVLVALVIFAEQQSIKLASNFEVSIASLVCIFAAVVFGPLFGAAVAGASMFVHLRRRDGNQPVLRWAAWTSIRFMATIAAGLAAAAILRAGKADFWTIFAAVAGAFLADTVVDVALFPIAAVIRGTATLKGLIDSAWGVILASVPLHVPLVAILAYSYETISPWSVALFGIPAFAAQRLFLLYRAQQETLEALGTANARLASANLSFATALVATLDARDRYTAGHSTAVAVYARDIAKRMGLSEPERDLVHLCGLVHDIGKIGLPAGLLEKPGALTLEERREMERHPVIGEEILRNVADYGEIAEIVRSHHERIDGTGYPDGLVGSEIPLLARVIAVADAYNAMTSDRPYRDAMPSRVARLRLAQAVESQFDTSVVAAFEAVLAVAPESYRLGHGEEFDLRSAVRSHPELVPDEGSFIPLVPAEAVG
jgi:putative nucleotidyltransferase with HDIG domain